MDTERARQLLAAQREQIEQEIAATGRGGSEEGDERREPGDFNSEGLYQDEFDAGRAGDLKERLAAVERASARLEANPTAELTVEEQDPGAHSA